MADLLFVALTLGFIALCIAYIAWCDRIIGPDDFGPDAVPEPSLAVDTQTSTTTAAAAVAEVTA